MKIDLRALNKLEAEKRNTRGIVFLAMNACCYNTKLITVLFLGHVEEQAQKELGSTFTLFHLVSTCLSF